MSKERCPVSLALEAKATWSPSAEIDGSSDSTWLGVPAPPLLRETRIVVAVARSRTKTSSGKLCSSTSSPTSGAREVKATRLPSAEIEGSKE